MSWQDERDYEEEAYNEALIRNPDPDENPLVIMSDLANWSEESCPACGELADYCLGHGEIGDPTGFLILQQHDNEDHTSCNPRGCGEANDA